MKKITGKALSLVLSLALVVSSFSVSLASASTRTADGIVGSTDKNSIYLVNGGTGDAAESPELINTWIKPTIQTSTRKDADTIKVDAISHVSGDSLVSLSYTYNHTTSNDHTAAYLKLKSQSVKGTEVISILYEGSYTDDNGNDYTIKARKNFTVYVYDKDAPVLAEVKDSNHPETQPGTAGKGLDDFETFAQTRNTTKTVGLYLAEPAAPGVDATLKYAPIYVTADKNGLNQSTVNTTDGTSGGVTLKDSAYYLEITDGKSDLHFDYGSSLYTDAANSPAATATTGGTLVELNAGTASAFTLHSGSGSVNTTTGLYPKDASTTNVTFTLKRLTTSGKVSTSSDDKYTFKTKIEKKINVAQAYVNGGVTSDGTYSVAKSDGQTRLIGVTDPLSSDVTATSQKYLNVSDAILDFPQGTKSVTIGDDQNATNTKGIVGYVGDLTIGQDARVGDINIKDGTVDVNGKVGNITTDYNTINDTPANTVGVDGSVLIEGTATAGNIDTTNESEPTVTITGGTTGTVTTKNSVTIDGLNSDNNITTGVVTAVSGTIYSDEANVTVAGLTAKDDSSTGFVLSGDAVTVKSVDLDSRTTTLQFGDTDTNDSEFKGTVAGVKNASNATIKAVHDDTNATISGDLNADQLSLDTNTKLTLPGNTQVNTIDGDGTLTIPAGKLYVADSVSSTRLKLSDATIAVGTTVFTAKADAVNEDDFTPYGFTLAKTSGNTTDTFKIAALSFAGPQITGTASELLVGQTGTYTASAYPTGTSIPTGYTVEWSLDGGSSDVFTLASTDNTATVKVNSIDPNFASENKTTLTATLYDADGYEVTDYDPATYDISAVAALTGNYKSDTTGTVNLKVGGSYQFKITSTDGSVPSFVVAGNGGAAVTGTSKSGNDYFFKVTAQKTGDYGVYVNKGARVAVLHITSDATIDTTAVTIKAGSTYQFKVTSSAKPVFGLGSSAAVLSSSSVSGTNYFYKVKAAGKAGDKVGVYVNGARLAVITVG